MARANKHDRQAGQRYSQSNSGHWVRRIIKEMKQNKAVQEKVVSGKLDRYLTQKQDG